MSFSVGSTGLTEARIAIQNVCGELCARLEESKETVSALGGTGFSGKAAENLLAYVNEVHGFAAPALQTVISAYCTKLSMYVDGLVQLDEDIHALIPQDDLETAAAGLQLRYDEVQSIDSGLQTELSAIYDIAALDKPSVGLLCSGIEYERTRELELADSVIAHEGAHAGDLEEIDVMITQLENLVEMQNGKSRIGAESYTKGALLGMLDMAAFAVAAKQLTAYLVDVQDDLETVMKHEVTIADTLIAEAAHERMVNGIWSAVGALGTIVVGVASIVCTAGASTPVALTAIAMVTGTGTTLYGMSNLGESAQEIYYGANGDIYSVSYNDIRDGIFGGNQTAYDIWGTANTIIAGATIPAGKAYGVAASAGMTENQAAILAMRAVAVESGKGVVSGYAGTVAGDYVTEVTGDENLGRLAQLGTSAITGLGLDSVDTSYNLSGLHPKTPMPEALMPDKGASVPEGGRTEVITVDKTTKEVTYDIIDADGNVVSRNTVAVNPERGYLRPTSEYGEWVGGDEFRGNSTFIPDDPAMQRRLSEFGLEGVDYSNDMVDFEPFATLTDTPYGDFDSTVKIDNMSGDRTGAGGNFDQFYEALSDKLGVPEGELKKYAKENGYTVHECPDGIHSQWVPTDIHDFFSHTGGTSYSDYIAKNYGFLEGVSRDTILHIDAALESAL